MPVGIMLSGHGIASAQIIPRSEATEPKTPGKRSGSIAKLGGQR